MRIRVVLPTAEGQRLKETISQSGDIEEENNGAEEWGAVSTIASSFPVKIDTPADPPHRPVTIPSDQRSFTKAGERYRPDRDSSNGRHQHKHSLNVPHSFLYNLLQ